MAKDPAIKAKKDEPPPELTPLEKMLQNAGPLRPDGSDKFFGLENVRRDPNAPLGTVLFLVRAYMLTLLPSSVWQYMVPTQSPCRRLRAPYTNGRTVTVIR